MKFEPVYMVWNFFDGVRSGIASYAGAPHYFECEFDAAQDDYSEVYDLWPIDQALFNLAQEQHQIYRAWEWRFRLGQERTETHPAFRGQNARYDELEDRIKLRLKSTVEPIVRARAKFRAARDQPERPVGCFGDVEVQWSPVDPLQRG